MACLVAMLVNLHTRYEVRRHNCAGIGSGAGAAVLAFFSFYPFPIQHFSCRWSRDMLKEVLTPLEPPNPSLY